MLEMIRGADRQLTVSCQAIMPSIQGEQMPLGKVESSQCAL